MKSKCAVWVIIGIVARLGGCRKMAQFHRRSDATFSLAWSEYPSWSVFGVADELGLIDGDAGQLGSVEKKYGIDIELKEAGYDSCLNMFSSGDCDAVCITNMDALIVSPSRDAVAVLPTSTSKGADACLCDRGDCRTSKSLKQYPVYGLENTVSEYCFVRCLEKPVSRRRISSSQTRTPRSPRPTCSRERKRTKPSWFGILSCCRPSAIAAMCVSCSIPVRSPARSSTWWPSEAIR